MFEPSREELADAEDLFSSLLAEGRSLLRTPEAHRTRLEEQQAFIAARAARAAAASMARLQWRPQTSVALINRYTCINCGSETHLFAGYAVEMRRNSDASTRLLRTACLDQAYPRETHYLDTGVQACSLCLPAQGFEVENG